MLRVLLILAIVAVAVWLLRKQAWMRAALRWLWRVRNEWLAIPLAAALYLASSALLRWVDPHAGLFDVGVLQGLFVGAVQFLVAMTTAQVGTAISYKRVWKPAKNEPVCKEQYVALYALYFLGCVVLMAAL